MAQVSPLTIIVESLQIKMFSYELNRWPSLTARGGIVSKVEITFIYRVNFKWPFVAEIFELLLYVVSGQISGFNSARIAE